MKKLAEIYTSKGSLEKLLIAYRINKAFGKKVIYSKKENENE